jgi:hypothetical protein
MRTQSLAGVIAASLCTAVLFAAPAAYATHPLGTEEPETVAPKAIEGEITYELNHFGGNEGGSESEGALWLGTGIVTGVDLGVFIPFRQLSPDEGNSESGIGDVEAELKWNFLPESETAPALALKIGVGFPSADERKGLGSGGYDLFATLLAGKGFGPVETYLNLGYTRIDKLEVEPEEGAGGEEAETLNRSVYSASLAARWNVVEQLGLVAEVQFTSAEAKGDDAAVSATVGAIWQITPAVGIDVGGRFGLTDAAADWTILAGLNFAFGEEEAATEAAGR